ncbi:MAG TPA: BREX protein BrxB domain-containing protein [Ktedonobacteraceae bacterium]|jgi:hypothetical protein
MLSLEERIDLLEQQLKAVPMQISAYHDLPFAILRYEPEREWDVRRQARQLATRLEQTGKQVKFLSLASLLWQAIAESEGLEAVVDLEKKRGFRVAQEQVTTYLSDTDWHPLPNAIAGQVWGLNPAKYVVFLMRAGAMAPAIYHMSKLLDELQGKTLVPIVLFYPGSLEGTTGLRFMDLKDREAMGNYRVKIYS